MVDTNSHNGDAATPNAVDAGAATQKMPAGKTATGSAAGATGAVAAGGAAAAGGGAAGASGKVAAGSTPKPSASGSLSGGLSGNVSGSLPDGAANDPVALRRAAHGLAPETAADVAKVKRMEKEATAEDRKRKAQRKHKAKIVRRTAIVLVLVLIIGALVGFWLLRWGLHDDRASIQGTWRVQGTDTTITINDEEIVLTDEVAYDYVLDPESKTLSFKFGALTGDGRYRFSLDHNMLAIDDGEFDAMGTLMTDIPWTIEAVAQKFVGNQEKSPSLEDGNMVLERVS